MNRFFPVGSTSVTGSSSASAAAVLPTGGPIIRISRDTSSESIFIKFGGSDVVATTSSMELVSGIVEELENPNTAVYTHYSVITLSGTCKANISTGPRFNVNG